MYIPIGAKKSEGHSQQQEPDEAAHEAKKHPDQRRHSWRRHLTHPLLRHLRARAVQEPSRGLRVRTCGRAGRVMGNGRVLFGYGMWVVEALRCR